MGDIAGEIVKDTQKAFEEIKKDLVAAVNKLTETCTQKIADAKTIVSVQLEELKSHRSVLPSKEIKERCTSYGQQGQTSITFFEEESIRLVTDLVNKGKEQLQALYEGSKILLGQAAKLFEDLLTELLKFLDELLQGAVQALQDFSAAMQLEVLNQCKQLIFSLCKK